MKIKLLWPLGQEELFPPKCGRRKPDLTDPESVSPEDRLRLTASPCSSGVPSGLCLREGGRSWTGPAAPGAEQDLRVRRRPSGPLTSGNTGASGGP